MKTNILLAMLIFFSSGSATTVLADPIGSDGAFSPSDVQAEQPLFRVDSDGNVYATTFIQVCPNGVEFYRDQDNDGFGAPGSPVIACSAIGYVSNYADCDDGDPAIHPGAESTDAACVDSVDNDCDGYVDCDDYDCACAVACGGSGCDPCQPGSESTDAACVDSVDNDCDGYVDCDDYDCACAVACGGTGCDP
jgi:hypothetical protein